MKQKLLYLAIILLLSINSFSQIPFAQRLQGGSMNIKGNITFAANNILNRDSQQTLSTLYKNNGTSFVEYTGDDNPNVPYMSDLFLKRIFNGRAEFIEMKNSDFFLDYIDIDDEDGIEGSEETFSSSKSTLTVPPCSKIAFAGLYWSGVYPFESWEEMGQPSNDFTDIRFKLPGENYNDITADETIFNQGDPDQRPYVCYTDMTDVIQSLTNANGDYYAANIRATVGRDISNNFGGAAGWVLVVIYEDANETFKNISVFDGFSTINESEQTDIIFSGFTTPQSGAVRASFLTAALEGDSFFPGDSFQLRDITGNYQGISSGGTNLEDNFFNGSITINNEYVNDRFPNSSDTFGFDVDLFEIENSANSLIANNQTAIDARFTTEGDVYFPFLNAMVIEYNIPDVVLINTVDDNAGNNLTNGVVGLGSDVWYDLAFQNTGHDNATNTIIDYIIPKNVTLNLSDISVPLGVTYIYTEALETNNYHESLQFTIPDNLVKINGSVHNIRLHVQVASSCSEFKGACSNSIQSAALISYNGTSSGIVISEDLSISGFDTCNNGIQGTTNLTVDVNNCQIIEEITSCGDATVLEAGEGYFSYTWVDVNGTVVGTDQILNVTASGEYTVTKEGDLNGCLSLDETYIVNILTNPLLPYADAIVTCLDNGIELLEIYKNALENIEIDIDFDGQISWSILDCNSTSNNCPELDNSCWKEISNTKSITLDSVGNYRLTVICDGGSLKDYYFNISEETLSTNDEILKELKAYPNPVDAIVTLPSVLIGSSYTIFNVLGVEVTQGEFTSNTLDLNTLSSGIYFLNTERYSKLKIIKK